MNDSLELSVPEWNYNFRLRVLALCLNHEWWSKYGSTIISPQYFPNQEERLFVEICIHFYGEYARPPFEDEMEILLDQFSEDLKEEIVESTRSIIDNVYTNYEEWDLDFAEDYYIQFVREQAHKLAVLDCVEYIQSGQLSKLEGRMREAGNIGRNLHQLGIFLKKDAADWIIDIAEEVKVPTGIYHMDNMLNGGLSKGELGVILGPTNRGKSRALLNFAFGAAGWGSACNVCYLTMELSKEKAAKRLGARTVHTWMGSATSVREYYDMFIRESAITLEGEINLIQLPAGKCGINDINNHLDILKSVGFDVDLLLVDSEDDMIQKGDAYDAHGNNYTMLRGMATERDIAIWTSAQGGRASLSKSTVDLDDMAESIKKAWRADIIMTWSQTRQESDDDEMRFYCAKNRDGGKFWYVKCELDEQAHSIVSVGILDSRGEELIR